MFNSHGFGGGGGGGATGGSAALTGLLPVLGNE